MQKHPTKFDGIDESDVVLKYPGGARELELEKLLDSNEFKDTSSSNPIEVVFPQRVGSHTNQRLILEKNHRITFSYLVGISIFTVAVFVAALVTSSYPDKVPSQLSSAISFFAGSLALIAVDAWKEYAKRA